MLVHRFELESKIQSNKWKYSGSTPLKKFNLAVFVGKMIVSVWEYSEGVNMID